MAEREGSRRRPANQLTPDFLRVLRASGLVDAAQLEPLLAPFAEETGPVPEQLLAALIEDGRLTRWQLGHLRKGKYKGFRLGKYTLLDLLGAGGMGSVYLAEHATLGHKVAIKVLPEKSVEKTSFLARFRREARAAANLNHPNIARAVDIDNAGQVHFMVMEYVEGTDLHGRVKQDGPLGIHEAIDFIRQAAAGLDYVHDEGFVHRDIKPANLMVNARGLLKILDLGLALLKDDDEEASLTKKHKENVLGTADYLAPEQSRNSHTADKRSDIYSLGCTFHYLLVGKPPFSEGKAVERIRAHRDQPPPNLLEARSDVPPEIAELYLRMMEKHPEARPQTAGEVAEALGSWLARNKPPAKRAAAGSSTPKKRPPIRRGSPADTARIGRPRVAVRSGPGSSGSLPRGSSTSGLDLGSGISSRSSISLTTTPPPSSGSRGTVPSPRSGRRGDAAAAKPSLFTRLAAVLPGRRPGLPATVQPERQPAAAQPRQPAEARRRRSLLGRLWLGQPIGLWLAMVGILVLIGVLAVFVLQQQQ